jgi:carbon monoxide dehydrogenase subunit G
MATITEHIAIAAPPERAWAALRDVARPHLAFPGVLTDARLEGDRRVVTFADGLVVTEQIVTVDDRDRRLAYTVLDGPFTHHHASFAVTEAPDGRTTVTWVTDLLPDDVAPMVADLMRQGAAALASTLGG